MNSININSETPITVTTKTPENVTLEPKEHTFMDTLNENKERKMIELICEIEGQAILQKSATEFFELIYEIAFRGEAELLSCSKEAIYSMYVKAENARMSICNAIHDLRLLIDVSQIGHDKQVNYKPFEMIDEIYR